MPDMEKAHLTHGEGTAEQGTETPFLEWSGRHLACQKDIHTLGHQRYSELRNLVPLRRKRGILLYFKHMTSDPERLGQSFTLIGKLWG